MPWSLGQRFPFGMRESPFWLNNGGLPSLFLARWFASERDSTREKEIAQAQHDPSEKSENERIRSFGEKQPSAQVGSRTTVLFSREEIPAFAAARSPAHLVADCGPELVDGQLLLG